MGTTPKVYVSCAPNWEFREKLEEGLRAAGYEVLDDRSDRIRIGENFAEIKRAAELRKWDAADYIIVTLHQSHLMRSYVMSDLTRALRREDTEGRTIVLPIWLGNLLPLLLLPESLRTRAGAKLTSLNDLPNAISELTEAIKYHSAPKSKIHSEGGTPVRFDNDLVMSIRSGGALLYAGAGLSAPAGLPVWNELASKLVQNAAEENVIDSKAQAFLTKALEDRKTDYVVDEIVSLAPPAFVTDTLRRIFLGKSPTEAHNLLVRLPFAAALTTNFDDLLEQSFAFRMRGIPGRTPSDTDDLLSDLTLGKFFVLKLYGSPGRPETLLVSPAQFDDAVSRNQPFANLIESLFVTRTILFVGCSLEGIDVYLRGLRFRGQSAKKHYALSGVIGTPYETMAGVLQRRYNIQVIPYRLMDTEGLTHALRILVEEVGDPPAESWGGARSGTRSDSVSPLRRIALNNIGPFLGQHEIVLDPNVTVFLGNNGVGKSTLLRAVAAAICGRDAEAHAARLLNHNQATGSVRLETERSTYQLIVQRTTAGVEVTSLPMRPLEPENWLVIGFPPLRTTSLGRPGGPVPESLGIPNANDVLPLLKGPVDSRLDDLQAWIVNLDYRSKDNPGEPRFRRAIDKFVEIAGILTAGIKLEFQGVDAATRRIRVVTEDGPIPLDELSQGTSSLLACVGVIVQRLFEVYGDDEDPTARPLIVLMDEIDAHMHPAWQRTLISRLRTCFPNLQLIATSHSPLIVAGLEKENVYRLVRNGGDRHVSIRQYEMKLKGQEIDDLLASPLFGLEDTRDVPTVEAEQQYERLCALENPSPEEAAERELLEMELFGPRGAYAKLHDHLNGQISAISKDEQLRRLRSTDDLTEQLAEQKDRP